VITPALQSKIPRTLGGVPVKLQQTYEDEIDGDFVNQYGGALLQIPGVFAVGVGHDERDNATMFVTVDKITAAMRREIPNKLGPFPVMFEKGSRVVAD